MECMYVRLQYLNNGSVSEATAIHHEKLIPDHGKAQYTAYSREDHGFGPLQLLLASQIKGQIRRISKIHQAIPMYYYWRHKERIKFW